MAGPLAASYTLPADILINYFEDFMLFSFVNNLCQEASVPVPQDITLFAYNDLTYWAFQHLPAQHQEDLTSYLDAPPACGRGAHRKPALLSALHPSGNGGGAACL